MLCFLAVSRVAHLFSFLCCVFWWCHVLLIFLVFCVVFFGGVTCCSSFQFSVLCFLVVSRVANLFSFLCCVFWWCHVLLIFSVFCDVLSCLFAFCLSSSYVLCAHCCQCLWIVHSRLLLRFSLTDMYLNPEPSSRHS